MTSEAKEIYPKLDDKITCNEAFEVILKMRDSAPGSNGLTISFYKKYFKYFGEAFVEILNDDTGVLPNTFNESIIKLIPKNDKNVKGINDLRPISLTNFEYRIYTKILVNRFNRLGARLFQDTQTCSVKGRRINDSINLIKDAIENAVLKEIGIFLVSVDQRKAFDSMSHRYLFSLFNHLDISNFLNNSIKRIYSNSYAYIVFNRIKINRKIIIRRGIKQGCALSMFIYTAGIEELLVRIHLNNKIQGYLIKTASSIPLEIKSSAYADDTVGLHRNLDSIEAFFEEFKDWGRVSGASINEDKTKILAISSNKTNYKNFKFVDKLKILGITFSNKGVDKENLDICLNKINTTLNIWNTIKLNMLERITVLRTFALSKLWYQANFVLLNELEIKKIETMCFKFIWNGCELIKRSTLLLDYTEGGRKMLDIRAKLTCISGWT